ncbi:Glutamine--tRNA ligase, cytoplasmic [Asimina triloba]
MKKSAGELENSSMVVKDEENRKSLELFLKIGLDERTAKNTLANAKVTASLNAVIQEDTWQLERTLGVLYVAGTTFKVLLKFLILLYMWAFTSLVPPLHSISTDTHHAAVTSGCSKAVGNHLYTVSTKFPANALIHRPTLLEYIVSLKIKSPNQLDAAFAFFAGVGPEQFTLSEFEKACGVGVEVSLEDIEADASAIFDENKDAIMEQRYGINVGILYKQVRERKPWADMKAVKDVVDRRLRDLLGERTAADNEKPVKKKEKPAKVEVQVKTTDSSSPPSEEDINPFTIFPRPEENLKEKLEMHLKATGGKVYTRFPPEPNGYLHIGHAKAMFIDFGLAKDRDGCCYLRFDDTNPEAEKKEYIDHIQEIVRWMGWEPFKVTYTSDYFQDLYDLSVELIRRGQAYVDHQVITDEKIAAKIKEYREKKLNSPWRDRPIEESLKLFEDMRQGMIEEGKATLRMKQDMQSDNYNMYDLIAYRIKASFHLNTCNRLEFQSLADVFAVLPTLQYTPHPHAGDKWCIYPSYDYAHCIVDSLENITHSLCTLEFETRRASYYWLLEALDLYKPYVWEYSRLNITNTVMSKRKLNRLVTEKWVDGWDDPRLMTLAGLRRRGISSTAINSFVRGIGITRRGCSHTFLPDSDNSLIRLNRLEYHIREEMNKTAPRTMVVLHPLKVVIMNLEVGQVMHLDAKLWPDANADDPSAFYKLFEYICLRCSSSAAVPFTNIVYIEHSDFRIKDSKDYYGLAPGKSVLLRYAFPIKCTEVIYGDDKETVVELRAEYDPSKRIKPKGVLHWVAQPSPGIEPLKVECRLFDKLFLSENPAELDDWLGDLNPSSKEVIPDAYAVPTLASAVLGDKFQFERLGKLGPPYAT